MQQSSNFAPRSINLGDAAIDGLFAGAIAGLAMAGYLTLTALLRGEGFVTLFNRFAPTQASEPLAGFLMHLAVSGIYGILFGILWALTSHMHSLEPLFRHAALLGVLYGVILFFLAWYLLLPASNSQLLKVPFFDLGLAHIIYGAMLGFLTQRIGLREINR
jgi:hypothetical protein